MKFFKILFLCMLFSVTPTVFAADCETRGNYGEFYEEPARSRYTMLVYQLRHDGYYAAMLGHKRSLRGVLCHSKNPFKPTKNWYIITGGAPLPPLTR